MKTETDFDGVLIENWPRSEWMVTPDAGLVVRVFSKTPSNRIPCSVEARKLYDAYRAAPEDRKPKIFDKTLRIETAAGAEVLPLLTLLLQNEALLRADPCEIVAVRQRDPSNPVEKGAKPGMTGWYGVVSCGAPVQLTLLLDERGELVRTDGEYADYARTLVHELGHGATMFCPDDVPSRETCKSERPLEGLLRNIYAANKTAPEITGKLFWRLSLYENHLHTRELAADIWLVSRFCLNDWKQLRTECPGIEKCLSEIVAASALSDRRNAGVLDERNIQGAAPTVFVEYDR